MLLHSFLLSYEIQIDITQPSLNNGSRSQSFHNGCQEHQISKASTQWTFYLHAKIRSSVWPGKVAELMLTNYPSPSTFLLKLSGKINTIVIDGELPQKLKTACREHDVDTVIIDK
jgi:hypothetical protein